jgi:hypothetical protein
MGRKSLRSKGDSKVYQKAVKVFNDFLRAGFTDY